MIKFNKIFDLIEEVAFSLSSIALVAIMFVTTIDVFLRKTTGSSIPSLYEFTEEYLMVAVVFFSMSYVYKIGGHVRVTLFLRFIPKSIMTKLNIVLGIMYLIFFAIMFVQGFKMAAEAWKYSELSSSVLAYPMAPALFMVPVGALLVCVRIAQKIITAPEETEQLEE